ncbi:MAG: recombinase family protein, partial [Candidatus Marinimicrobia bacterium]|nr:recombinase family protein [Candidatus Neomarinimicrobiota bacterium]
MKNTFSLVRISTIIQSEENGGTGIQFQTEKLSQYATLNDLNLIKTITDVCSGGLETRDGIEELKSHIENGDVDIVLIWNVSRAFRSMIHFTKFYEYLKKHDVELISVSEGIRSSSKTGSMMFGIMVSIASFEKSVITERMVSGRTTKVKSGVRGFGSKLPFGYCKNTDGEIVLDEDNSKVVQYIFRKMNLLLKNSKLTKSKRTRRLLKLLHDRNFTYDGKPFTRWNVRDILNNTFYFGELKYGEIKTNHN